MNFKKNNILKNDENVSGKGGLYIEVVLFYDYLGNWSVISSLPIIRVVP